MHASAADPDWQMTFVFLLALGVLGFVMKLMALLVPSASIKTRWAFLLSLSFSPNSLHRVPLATSVTAHVRRIVFFGAMVVCYYWVYWQVVRRFELEGVILSYLAVPALLLMGEMLAAFVSLLWLPSGRPLPPLHNNPLLARSIAEFWGRRWNLWFSDWFRYTIFLRLRERPGVAVLVVFAVSGIMHEWVINVPLFFVTGRMLFGSMMVYFLLQAAGILIERRLFKRNSPGRILFAWIIIFVPAPLVLNEGLLRTLHLWAD